MNYEQANAVKELAPKVNEVLEGLEWECPECKGKGRLDLQGVSFPKSGLQCDKCNGIGKIHYSWTPQVGEWCIVGETRLITFIAGNYFEYAIGNGYGICARESWKKATSILEWEKIEKVLEKAGYDVVVHRSELSGICGCTIHKNNKISRIGNCKTRIKAVYEVVIELGKQKKHYGI